MGKSLDLGNNPKIIGCGVVYPGSGSLVALAAMVSPTRHCLLSYAANNVSISVCRLSVS
jgi:hypothetical protein